MRIKAIGSRVSQTPHKAGFFSGQRPHWRPNAGKSGPHKGLASCGYDTAQGNNVGTYIDEPISVENHQGNSAHFYHCDHRYSVAALTDESGQVTRRYGYDSYGGRVKLNADGTLDFEADGDFDRYGHTGRRHDDETGLQYFRARYYDGKLGRFVARDTYDGFVRFTGKVGSEIQEFDGPLSAFALRGKPRAFVYNRDFYGNPNAEVPAANIFVIQTVGRPFMYHDGMSLYRSYFMNGVDPTGYNGGPIVGGGEDPPEIEKTPCGENCITMRRACQLACVKLCGCAIRGPKKPIQRKCVITCQTACIPGYAVCIIGCGVTGNL